jgi:hypothetical protein
VEGGTWLARLGDTDCEAFVDGVLAQPVNSLSSVAFLAVGAALVWWGLRQPRGRRLLVAVYGAAVASNGLGGLLYHGPAWPGSTWVHDVALVAPLVFIVLYDVGTVRPMSSVQLLGAYGVIMALVGMLIAAVPRYALVASAVFAALALGTELMAAGRRYAFRKARQAYAVMIGALGVGVIFNILGRTDGPLCAADSPFQGHAVWHACTAVALGAWGVAAFTARRPQPARAVLATDQG